MAQRQRSSQRGTRTLALPQPEGPSHQLGLFPVGSVADCPAGSQQPGRTLGTVADPGGRKQRCARPRERRRPGPQPPPCRTPSRCALLHAPHGLVVFPAILYEGPRKETCSVPSHCSRAFRRGLAEHLGVRCDARSPHHGPYGPLETKGAGRREPRKAPQAALQGPVLPGSARPRRTTVGSWPFPGKASSGQPHLQSRVGGPFPVDSHLEVTRCSHLHSHRSVVVLGSRGDCWRGRHGNCAPLNLQHVP